MRLKTDKLLVSVYARHGDMCGLADSYGHHDSLQCASGHKEADYVLCAKFAYFQEGIEYAQMIAGRGVNARLVSHIGGAIPYVSDYAPKAEPYVQLSDSLCDRRPQ